MANIFGCELQLLVSDFKKLQKKQNRLAKDNRPKVITEKEEQVLEILSRKKFLGDFYLAGGTALALQIFHRKSLDLDFFSSITFEPGKIIDELNLIFGKKVKVRSLEKGTLHVNINDSMVSFLEFIYPLLNKEQKRIYGVKVAGIEDIAAMKLSAIHGRGSKKDFFDIFFILKDLFSLAEIILFYRKKFSMLKEDVYLLLKSLTYFENAEDDPEPLLLKKADWKEIKKYITSESTKYSKKILL